MNSNEVINVLFAGVVVTVAFVISFWTKVLDWAKNTLLPFIAKYSPEIRDYIREAFSWVDDNVAVHVRRIVKAAWKSLRQQLLKMAMYFERTSSSKWVRRTTSYVIKLLGSQQVTKQVVEEEIDWDDLSPEIRRAWMKSSQESSEIDITAERDQRLDSLNMSN